MNFLAASVNAINRQGVNVTYRTVTEGAYDVNTGTVTNVESDITVKAYPREIIATQYNFPNLIGKRLVEFYVANPTLVVNPNDKIVFGTDVFTVLKYRSHFANGQVCLFCIYAVKT